MSYPAITPSFILNEMDCADDDIYHDGPDYIRRFRKNFGDEMDVNIPLTNEAIYDTHWHCLARRLFSGKDLEEFENIYKEANRVRDAECKENTTITHYQDGKRTYKRLRNDEEYYKTNLKRNKTLAEAFIRTYKKGINNDHQ